MPAIADTHNEMQESTPAFLDATCIVQASKERLAKKKLALQQAQAKAAQIVQAEQAGKEREQEEENERIPALLEGEREEEVEAAEKVAEQETSRRNVAAHMSEQQGTSSAYLMRPDAPADSALTALAGNFSPLLPEHVCCAHES
jgi:hypothetical protein